MDGTFRLAIELGNEAMSTPEDIVSALEDVAQEIGFGRLEGSIRDGNGNTVGTWDYKGEAFQLRHGEHGDRTAWNDVAQ